MKAESQVTLRLMAVKLRCIRLCAFFLEHPVVTSVSRQFVSVVWCGCIYGLCVYLWPVVIVSMASLYVSLLGSGTDTSGEVRHRCGTASAEWSASGFLGPLLLWTTVCHSLVFLYINPSVTCSFYLEVKLSYGCFHISPYIKPECLITARGVAEGSCRQRAIIARLSQEW